MSSISRRLSTSSVSSSTGSIQENSVSGDNINDRYNNDGNNGNMEDRNNKGGKKPDIRLTTPKDKSAGKVTWEGKTKQSEGGTLPTNRRNRIAIAPLTPLTPLTKAGPEGDILLAEDSRRPGVVYAYSSPNLTALNNPSNYEQARLVTVQYENTGGSVRPTANYVDPLYRQLNPSVRSEKAKKPVWSLNQPLPHVLDQNLAGKVQKNLDAKSRASSRSASRAASRDVSRDVSRSGSKTSMSDWKSLLRRGPSYKRLNDLEAQLPSTSAASTRAKSERAAKRRQSQATLAPSVGDQGHHNATFTLGDGSSAVSIANQDSSMTEKPQVEAIETVPSHSQTLRRKLEQLDRSSVGNVGGGGGAVVITDGAGGGGDALADSDSEPMVFPNPWAKFRYYMREPFAECFGTLILVIFGVGGNLQATVSKGSDGTFGTPGGSFESLSFAWGFGCMLGVYVAGGISGGHVNPAVTISMAIFRNFPWKKVPVYIVAQIFGAFFGGAMAYGYFWSSITALEGGKDIRTAALTGACLYTNPKPYVTWRNAFFDEFIGGSILVGCLMALLDDTNAPPTNGMTAFVVGLLVAAIGMALGYQTSFTINPARDLGPRIFAAMIGYGSHPFHLTHWWWIWGGWLGPIGGGIAGALVYDLFIFTGCESPVNYPDNGYIEHRVNKIFHTNLLLPTAGSDHDDASGHSELADHNSAATADTLVKNVKPNTSTGSVHKSAPA